MKFNEEHEWVKLDEDIATIGISNYAVEQLGDITFVELPEVDSQVSAKDSVAFIESVKAASDIYTPLSGTICEINEALLDTPESMNTDPEDTSTNWIFKIKISNKSELDELMDKETYTKFITSL
jgi:glycine cleavage system H protein